LSSSTSASPGGFAVGMPVQCFNQQEKRWSEGIDTRMMMMMMMMIVDALAK